MIDSDRSKLTLREQLAEPFDPAVVGWKPQMVKNNRALATAYIDARDVMNRLDEVFGVENWEDDYVFLESGDVLCRLTITTLIGQRKITKCDVGNPSDQPDKGDRMKAACSDALKRAAVKFGIGRYLYSIDAGWVDYDPVKKTVSPPRLPENALPYSMRVNRNRGNTAVPTGPATVAGPAPKPEPKPEPTKEVQKAQDFIDKNKPARNVPPNSAARSHDEWLNEAALRLDAVATPDDLTAVLSILPSVEPEQTRLAVKNMVVACKDEHGWKFNGESKAFYDPAELDTGRMSPPPQNPQVEPQQPPPVAAPAAKPAKGRKQSGK
jgi:hypothetical protein